MREDTLKSLLGRPCLRSKQEKVCPGVVVQEPCYDLGYKRAEFYQVVHVQAWLVSKIQKLKLGLSLRQA